MSAVITAPGDLYRSFRGHLVGRVEQVGFFLADFDRARRTLVLREWRPMPPEAFEIQSAYHVTLRDEVRPEIIKWAWDGCACLVEAHSHGDDTIAGFSSSDVWGFAEWVPHVRWRLRGRPYAAIVTADSTFDALAWIDGADCPEQVEQLEVDSDVFLATGRTLPRLSALKEPADDE